MGKLGGKRPGAGRPYTGRRGYTVRVRPETMNLLKKKARERKLTVGGLLEVDYGC